MVVNVVGSHDVEIRLFAGSAGHVPPANPWQIAGYKADTLDPPPQTSNDFSLGKDKIQVYTVKDSHKVLREDRILLAV
jgi:hypothetical protein